MPVENGMRTEVLGMSLNGVVCRGEFNAIPVAVKSIKKDTIKKDATIAKSRVDFLLQLNNENIVRLVHVEQDSYIRYVYLDSYCNNNDFSLVIED